MTGFAQNLPVGRAASLLVTDLIADDLRGVAADLIRLADDEFSAISSIADPFGYIRGVGLGFLLRHFQPLLDVLDLVTGDPAGLRHAGARWRTASTQVRSIAAAASASVQSGTDGWQGAAADACRLRFARFAAAGVQVADECAQLGDLLQASAVAMTAVRNIVLTIIQTLVEQLLAEFAVASATSALTAGASQAAFLASVQVQADAAALRAEREAARLRALLGLVRAELVTATGFMTRSVDVRDLTIQA